MMSRQKTLGIVLYGLAFCVVMSYFIECFEMADLRIKWMSSISSSDGSEKAERYFNYYHDSQWKTDRELSGQPTQTHKHKTFCVIWLVAAIILLTSAVGHSMIMLMHKASRMKKRLVDILTQEREHGSKDVSSKSRGTFGSFLNRPLTVKDEIAGGLVFLLLRKLVRLYRQRTRRSK